MANFDEALKLTALNEGGYSNDKNDHGGETYAGIASKYWPNWQGWPIIHQAVSNGTIHELRNNIALQVLVKAFYKGNFWNVNKLDAFNDQQLANSVYDFGVNSGVGHAAKLLQEAVGVNADGQIGNITLGAVNSADPDKLYNAYNALKKAFYEHLATDPTQHQFLSSWLSRLVPYQV